METGAIDGIDVVQIRLVPEKRLYFEKPVTSAVDVYNAVADKLRELDREVVVVLNNNARGQVISMSVGSIGGLSESIISPRELYKAAILSNSQSVILAHNHPAGMSPEPSQEDISATKRMIACGELLGIPVLDHVIVSGFSGEYFSFQEHGLMTTGELDQYLKSNFIVVPERAAENDGNERKNTCGSKRERVATGRKQI